MDTAVTVALLMALEEEPPKKRRKWSRGWYLRRRQYGHMLLLRELRDSEPGDYRNFMRMDGSTFDQLLDLVRPLIMKQDTIMRESISPEARLSITLRYFATGNTFEDLKFLTATSPQAIGKIVIETSEAIIHSLKQQQIIKMPSTAEEWIEVSNGFASTWNFPHCVGAFDGKHVAIKKPTESGSFYFNYKKFFSLVLMAVVNADYEFIMVDVGVNGRVSDGGVIAVTTFGQRLEDRQLGLPEPEPIHHDDMTKLPFVFVADDAFALSENLVKPYGGENLGKEENVFNYRLSRARRVSENVFGILVSRFGIFQRPIQLCPEKAATVTMACCYLHNFLRKKAGSYLRAGSVDWEDANHIQHNGEWRESQRELERLRNTVNRHIGAKAQLTRNAFRQYFNTAGRVPWQ